MPQSPSAAPRDEPVIRDRGDACPGALRLHAADDGFLARIRIPGGLLDAEGAAALADAADRLGDGHIEFTSRGNVQLRGLADGCDAALAERLDAAGLLPAPTHERVRNIVASPLSGLDGLGRAEVLPWVRALDRTLCASARAAELSGRFLFALDDGRGDVAALAPDVTLLALSPQRALVRLGAAADACEVAAQDAPRAALLAAEYFLDAAATAGTRAWRVAELLPEHALTAREFAVRLTAAGIDGRYAGEVDRPYAAPPRPGPVGARALCVLAPLGRMTSRQWRLLLSVAGAGGLRITPWRTVVLPHPRSAEPLAGAGLVLDRDSPWESVTACTGRPGCAKALADVRADARALVHDAAGALPLHWSGCARRCGHPRGTAWVDAVATGDGYALSVHGRPVPHHPGLALAHHPDLAAALAAARSTTPDAENPQTQ
ncbi:cobalamin biosynthesis protein CobG [Streptomyces sp. NPDC003038]|uniref:cobalamin biosynthesis protein CobG n=1 Tax=unclassified Streptomyces TaxID=2593676 RepID=UPI0033A3C493